MLKGFIAYPSSPREVGIEIGAAIQLLRDAHGLSEFTTWEENDIAGWSAPRKLIQVL